MTGSFGRGVFERLQQPVDRHVAAATVAFVATIAIAVALIVRWPGGAPYTLAIVGLVAATAAAVAVSMVLDRRNPYFRTREEVEQVLGLPVLAAYNAQHPTPNSQASDGFLGIGNWKLGVNRRKDR